MRSFEKKKGRGGTRGSTDRHSVVVRKFGESQGIKCSYFAIFLCLTINSHIFVCQCYFILLCGHAVVRLEREKHPGWRRVGGVYLDTHDFQHEGEIHKISRSSSRIMSRSSLCDCFGSELRKSAAKVPGQLLNLRKKKRKNPDNPAS